jgi:hypothetical protein
VILLLVPDTTEREEPVIGESHGVVLLSFLVDSLPLTKDSPGMRHLRRWKGSRHEPLVNSVSALALMLSNVGFGVLARKAQAAI